MLRSTAKMTRKSANSKRKILVLHGPNLNLLGAREPEVYGRETLGQIDRRLAATARAAGASLQFFQSNLEGELVDRVQRAAGQGVRFIIFNPAGYTHTSVALRDALSAVRIPFIEVHLSNVNAREPFRQRSFFSDIAVGTICGLGTQGYDLALAYALAKT